MKRTEIILKLLLNGRNTIEKFNKLTSLTDAQLEQEYKRVFNS